MTENKLTYNIQEYSQKGYSFDDIYPDGELSVEEAIKNINQSNAQEVATVIDEYVANQNDTAVTPFLLELRSKSFEKSLWVESALAQNPFYQYSAKEQLLTIGNYSFKVVFVNRRVSKDTLDMIASVLLEAQEHLELLSNGVKHAETNKYKEPPLSFHVGAHRVVEYELGNDNSVIQDKGAFEAKLNKVVLSHTPDIETIRHELNHAIDDFLLAENIYDTTFYSSSNPSHAVYQTPTHVEACQMESLNRFNELAKKTATLTQSEKAELNGYIFDIELNNPVFWRQCEDLEAIAYLNYYTNQADTDSVLEIYQRILLANHTSTYVKANTAKRLVGYVLSENKEFREKAEKVFFECCLVNPLVRAEDKLSLIGQYMYGVKEFDFDVMWFLLNKALEYSLDESLPVYIREHFLQLCFQVSFEKNSYILDDRMYEFMSNELSNKLALSNDFERDPFDFFAGLLPAEKPKSAKHRLDCIKRLLSHTNIPHDKKNYLIVGVVYSSFYQPDKREMCFEFIKEILLDHSTETKVIEMIFINYMLYSHSVEYKPYESDAFFNEQIKTLKLFTLVLTANPKTGECFTRHVLSQLWVPWRDAVKIGLRTRAPKDYLKELEIFCKFLTNHPNVPAQTKEISKYYTKQFY